MGDKKIYFSLDTRNPQTLYAQYGERKASIGIDIVPEVLDSHLKGKVLLYEEMVILAQDYLESVLNFKRNSN